MKLYKKLFPHLHFFWKLVGVVLLGAAYYLLVEYGVRAVHDYYQFETEWIINWGDEATIINGLILGLLLTIRYHKLFDRWWEARTIWGVLVNDIRNLTLKLDTYCKLTADEASRYAHNLTDFVQQLSAHLRQEEIPGEAGDIKHPPSRTVKKLYTQIHELREQDRMSFESFLTLDKHLRGLLDACGASERILQTRLPISYYALLRQGITVYLLLTPFYLHLEMMEAGLILYLVLVYFLVGGEIALSHLEELFERHPDGIKNQVISDRLEAYIKDVMVDQPHKQS